MCGKLRRGHHTHPNVPYGDHDCLSSRLITASSYSNVVKLHPQLHHRLFGLSMGRLQLVFGLWGLDFRASVYYFTEL